MNMLHCIVSFRDNKNLYYIRMIQFKFAVWFVLMCRKAKNLIQINSKLVLISISKVEIPKYLEDIKIK